MNDTSAVSHREQARKERNDSQGNESSWIPGTKNKLLKKQTRKQGEEVTASWERGAKGTRFRKKHAHGIAWGYQSGLRPKGKVGSLVETLSSF